jgi:hypothetical protein
LEPKALIDDSTCGVGPDPDRLRTQGKKLDDIDRLERERVGQFRGA